MSDVETQPECVICRGASGDAELHRIQVWEDALWRLTVSLDAEVLGLLRQETIALPDYGRAQARQLIRALGENPRPSRAKELRGKPSIF